MEADVAARCVAAAGMRPWHTTLAVCNVIRCDPALLADLAVAAADGSMNLALGRAAGAGRIDVVRTLLGRGADLRACNYALMWAAKAGHLAIVELLLGRGANVHTWDDAALRGAAAAGHVDVVALLLGLGAHVHARFDEALRGAAAAGHAHVVELLLASDADVHARGDEALQEAARYGHGAVVELLLRRGAISSTALLRAADNGDVRAVRLILDHGGTCPGYMNVALRRASHPAVVAMLIARGAVACAP